MAGVSHTNWELYLTLLSMGMGPTDAVQFVGVKLSTPYTRSLRYPGFKHQVDQAMEDGRRALIISPHHWAFPNGELILDGDFNPISRQPPSTILPWVLRQLRRNPLAALAS